MYNKRIWFCNKFSLLWNLEVSNVMSKHQFYQMKFIFYYMYPRIFIHKHLMITKRCDMWSLIWICRLQLVLYFYERHYLYGCDIFSFLSKHVGETVKCWNNYSCTTWLPKLIDTYELWTRWRIFYGRWIPLKSFLA